MKPFSAETLLVPTNGIQLHVQAAGPRDGPLVILLHGFPEFWYGWRSQIGPLAEAGYCVVVPDQRGYNLSQRPQAVAAYDLDELSKDIIGLIDAFGRDKAVVIGHDWGAAVAWHTAIHHADRVVKLVTLNVPHPAAHARAFRQPVFRQLSKSWYIAFFQIPLLPEWILSRRRCAAMRRMLVNTSRPGSFSQEDLERYVDAWLSRSASQGQANGITGMIHWYRAAARSVLSRGQHGYQKGERSQVHMPALILWGEKDVALIPELARWSLEWCSQGRLVRFPEATHWVQHDEAEAVTEHILRFLAE